MNQEYQSINQKSTELIVLIMQIMRNITYYKIKVNF